MSRRYAASERVWTYSNEYRCTVSIIPNRELTYQYDSPKYRQRVYHVAEKRMKAIADYIRQHGESTLAEIYTGCNMGKSAVRMCLDRNPQVFQARVVERKRRPLNLWSLREMAS